MKEIIVFITVANKKEGQKIAGGLIKKRLAACVNLVDKIDSLFWWQGKVDRAKEVLLVVKSKQAAFKKIISTVKKLHSYEVPEIVAIPIICGEKKYLEWLNDAVR